MPLRIALSLGGGGLKIAYLIGVVTELVRQGHTIVSADGVSAGALTTALLIQGDLHILEAVALGGLPGEYPALTNDVHRLKTGWELRGMLFGGPDNVDTFARNDRLWSNYLSRLIDPDRITIPGYVGACVWSEPKAPYRSIAHTEPEWARAVYGSATMPPPLWDPVLWNGNLLVDGGLRSTVPTDDVMDRIAKDEQDVPDMVLSVPTNRDREPTDLPGRGLDKGLVRTIGVLTSQIEMDDLQPKFWWPSVHHDVLRPTVKLGGTLHSTAQLQRDRYEHGVARVREMFGDAEGG
jgi:predicted acylesterase/phospholipase RssA